MLFLDELCEFRRDALEALRAPLETGSVSIARAGSWQRLPCRFMLVAAANPCPCGRGEADAECSCAPLAIQRYQGAAERGARRSHRHPRRVRQPSAAEIGGAPGERSAAVRARVEAARQRQAKRLGPGRCNAEMTPAEARECALERGRGSAARRLLRARRLSGRAHDRVLRLAQTIADLAGGEEIEPRADGAGAAAAADGTTSERRRAPAPTACAARGCWPSWPPTSRRSRPARPARARRNCCALQRGLVAAVAPKGAERAAAEAVEARTERSLAAASPRPGAGGAAATTRSIPRGLRDAADAPWALIGRGDPALLAELAEPGGVVTVVGARRASSYGREVARGLGRDLAAAGLRSSSAAWPSGSTPAPTAARWRPAARSPSSAAAPTSPTRPRTARSGGGSQERGLVLSELPPGTGAWRWTFPARNRIMAALAGMTVVVEAAERSGSLITADLAADLGRDLGAVPGPVTSRVSAGPNNLLAGGACLVRDAQDVLDAMLGPGARHASSASARRSSPARRRGPGRGRAGRGHLRRGRRRARPLRRARPPRRWPTSRRTATSPARCSASTPGTRYSCAARSI